MSQRWEVTVLRLNHLVRLTLLSPVLLLLLASAAPCSEAPQDSARSDAETTIDVKAGKVLLNLKVGEIDFTFAQIVLTPPAQGSVRIKLKVAGSNLSDHDHSAAVQATLLGASDVVISTTTKKREIEEGERDKGLDFEFRVTEEQLASGLKFKLKLTYIP
jgi:hypothetical protein